MAAELLVLVKHDCEVCDQVLPVLDDAAAGGAPLRILSQSSLEETEAQARRIGLRTVPAVGVDPGGRAGFGPGAAPPVLRRDGGEERGRVEGLQRERLAELAGRAGAELALDDLPRPGPGRGSPPRDPPGR